jgi:hypothetical protein
MSPGKVGAAIVAHFWFLGYDLPKDVQNTTHSDEDLRRGV